MIKNRNIEKFMKSRKCESLINFMLRINSGLVRKKSKKIK
jgi:hypothetical protein